MVSSNGVQVFAAENPDGWIELLEISSVQPNGENWFIVKGTETIVPFVLNTEKRLVKIEMLVWHQTADFPTSVSVTANGATTNLTVTKIESNLSRIYGELPNSYYEVLNLKFHKTTSGSAVWEMLSCKVTPVKKADYPCDAELWIRDTNEFLDTPCDRDIEGNVDSNYTVPTQFPVIVYDWKKYDSITIIGSITSFALNSVRASVGDVGLPYEITYTSSNSTGSTEESYTWADLKHYTYDDSYKGSIESDTYIYNEYNGKVLFNLTIDLTGIDRTVSHPMYCYFTGVYNEYFGYSVQIVGVTGSVNTADTSSLTWWSRFTTFMEDLFVSDDNSDMIENAVGQSQEVAEDRLGAIAQAGAVIDDLTGVFQYQGVMDTIAFPALTINFGGVPWTFGGWDVSVIPPGFEPLVETLKLLIDIVATLAFIQAMRHRLEKLLVGGNA